MTLEYIKVENLVEHLIYLLCVGILARVRKKKKRGYMGEVKICYDIFRRYLIPSWDPPDNTPVIHTPVCTTHFIQIRKTVLFVSHFYFFEI